jgi:hypothetical protein
LLAHDQELLPEPSLIDLPDTYSPIPHCEKQSQRNSLKNPDETSSAYHRKCNTNNNDVGNSQEAL